MKGKQQAKEVRAKAKAKAREWRAQARTARHAVRRAAATAAAAAVEEAEATIAWERFMGPYYEHELPEYSTSTVEVASGSAPSIAAHQP